MCIGNFTMENHEVLKLANTWMKENSVTTVVEDKTIKNNSLNNQPTIASYPPFDLCSRHDYMCHALSFCQYGIIELQSIRF